MPELRKITPKELAKILESHRHWWERKKEGEGANLEGANLEGANLKGAKISWSSHALLAELLWRAAGNSIPRQLLAAWVGRKTEWCWRQFLAFEHPERDWALNALAAWAQDGDRVPPEIRDRAERSGEAKAVL